MLTWLGVELCLTFAVDTGARSFRFLVSLFCLPCYLWAFLRISPWISACIQQLAQVLPNIIGKPVDVVIRSGGGEAFYNLMIKSQSFAGLVLLCSDLYQRFLGFLLPS